MNEGTSRMTQADVDARAVRDAARKVDVTGQRLLVVADADCTEAVAEFIGARDNLKAAIKTAKGGKS